MSDPSRSIDVELVDPAGLDDVDGERDGQLGDEAGGGQAVIYDLGAARRSYGRRRRVRSQHGRLVFRL